MTRALPHLLVLCAVAAVSGCASMQKAPLPHAPLFARTEAQVRVGVAETDITPPVGLGMFGHGPEARVATGTALRLRCQAFVVLGAGDGQHPGEALALLPCDLSAPGLLLQREIAERVAARGVPIGAERILLMATHTHDAPGHYFGVTNYTGPFSSRRTGFDPRMLALLADRMAKAIVDAYADAQPARLGWWQAPTRQALTRNRDPHPFLHNRYAPQWLRTRIERSQDHPEQAAVDPTLSLLRIDRLDTEHTRYVPLGLFAVLGMHPSANSNTSTLYSGDVFGYATRFVRDAIVAEHPASTVFVAGIANGIEGDVMPAREVAGLREARRFGHRVADELLGAWKALGDSAHGMDEHARVQVAYRELSLAGARTQSGAALCTRPELGTAAGGGANDHPTLLRFFPQYNPGATSTQQVACGAPKLPVLMLSGEAEAGREFPGLAPVSVVRLGSHTLVTLPAEVTTMAGVRIREAVADELGLPLPGDNVARNVVVIGLTNEYLQYVATPEEYELQYYEGASTLYGPNSARFLRDHAQCLGHALVQGSDAACRLEQPPLDTLTEWSYPKLRDAHLISETREPAAAPNSLGAAETGVTRDGLVAVSVAFVGPATDSVRRREDLWVELRREGTSDLIDDDRGTSIATEWQPYAHDGRGWTATWIPELSRLRAECGHKLFFVVGNLRGQARSQTFTLDCSQLSDLSSVWP